MTDKRPKPGDREVERIAESRRRFADRRPPVDIDFVHDQACAPHTDDAGHVMRIADAFGSRSAHFMSAQITALRRTAAGTVPAGEVDQVTNAAVAIVEAVRPENELEAALAVQMAQNHALSNHMANRAAAAGTTDHLQLYGNLAIKLQRTFTAQIEALARMRGKGQQTVRVEHVTVEAGAQAIVGDVHHYRPAGGAGVQPETGGQPYGTAPLSERATLPSPDPSQNGVPIPSDAEWALPDTRRTVTGRADRKPKRVPSRKVCP